MEKAAKEQTTKSLVKRLGIRIAKTVETVVSSLDTNVETIPFEEITTQRVAATIAQHLGNPDQERLGGQRYENPFSIATVLANMGYVGTSIKTDYFEKFREPYEKTRVGLNALTAQGVLETIPLQQPDKNGERFYYKVVNENRLRDISQKEVKAKTF